jgi:hypothetical protein
MNFRIHWRKRISDQLHTAAFLAIETGRSEVPLLDATAAISLRLSADPHVAGESRGGGERVLIEMPLTVWYEVFEDANLVLIYDAVLYPRRRL